MTREVLAVPPVGEAENLEVIEICVAVGDRVQVDDPLVVVESDKAAVEIPAVRAGVIEALLVAQGAQVDEGTPLVEITADVGEAGVTPTEGPAEQSSVAEAPAEQLPEQGPPAGEGGEPALKELRVPALGEFEDVEIIEVLVAPGDQLRREQTVIVLESDKAAMEIPATAAGKVDSLVVGQGDKVSEGDLILQYRADDESEGAKAPSSAPAALAPVPAAASARPPTPTTAPAPTTGARGGRRFTPVPRFAFWPGSWGWI